MALADPTTGQAPVQAPDVMTSRKASQEAEYREGEAELVEWVEGLFADAEKAKDEQCDPASWDLRTSAYWGDEWPASVPMFKPKIVINEIKSLALNELSDLTDSRITVFVQKDPSRGDRDEMVEKSIQGGWKRNFADLAVMNAALDSLIYPIGVLQWGWDPTIGQGQGDWTLVARDPYSYYPDPDATSDDDKSYEILHDVYDITAIREMWPETGWTVEPEAQWSTRITPDDMRRLSRLGSGFKSPMYAGSTRGGRVEGWKKARSAVLTCLVTDPKEIESMNEINGVLKMTWRKEFPHRRMIQIANRRVLFDGPNPFQGPITTRVCLEPTIHQYWPAASFVSQYMETQRASNKADSMVVENMMRLNAGLWNGTADCGIDPKTFANLPGQVILRKPGSEFAAVYPPPQPPEAVGMGQRLREYIRSNAGHPLTRQGAAQRGNVSNDLAETEIDQSMGITRLRARLLHQSVQRAVEGIFRVMALFYTVPRHVPFILNGQWQSTPWQPLREQDRQGYAVHVDEDSYSVKSAAAMRRVALLVARLGMMPPPDLFRYLNLPDAAALGQRAQRNLELMAMAKMKPGGKKK